MDNKQNQSNAGASSSASSSAANKSASQPATPKSGVSANATGASGSSAGNSGAEGSSVTNNVQSSQTGGQKSWLNQDQLLDTVNQLPDSLKEVGAKAKDLSTKAMGQVSGLSTTQKVVGGALLVSGLSWLALRNRNSKKSLADNSRYTPKGESKWKSSSEAVYRGTTSSLHSSANDVNRF
jgi:hypothetical protein